MSVPVILACPACATRFRVAPEALGARRRLRCANCGNVWHYRPPPATGDADAADRPSASEVLAIEGLGLDGADAPRLPAAAPVLRAVAPVVPPIEGRLPHTPTGRGRAAAGRRHVGIAVGFGLAFAAAVLLAAFLARDRLAAILPSSGGPPLATAVAPAGEGLKVTLTPKRVSGALVIDGRIINQAAVARRVPRLRLTLRDRQETALASQIINPPVVRLRPGASAHFNAVFAHPSGAATGVAVTFATD